MLLLEPLSQQFLFSAIQLRAAVAGFSFASRSVAAHLCHTLYPVQLACLSTFENWIAAPLLDFDTVVGQLLIQ